MNILWRYARAFGIALKMTLRGEVLPAIPGHPIGEWVRAYLARIDEVYRAAERSGLDQGVRQALKVRLDGRELSVETALGLFRHHAALEYPTLLRSGVSTHVLNTVYASNMNDLYRLGKLMEMPELQTPAMAASLRRLQAHLEQVPPP